MLTNFLIKVMSISLNDLQNKTITIVIFIKSERRQELLRIK